MSDRSFCHKCYSHNIVRSICRKCDGMCPTCGNWCMDKKCPLCLQKKVEELEREVEVLRQYGNKDCTDQADEVLEEEMQPCTCGHTWSSHHLHNPEEGTKRGCFFCEDFCKEFKPQVKKAS